VERFDLVPQQRIGRLPGMYPRLVQHLHRAVRRKC
jgi:hypothetical protein